MKIKYKNLPVLSYKTLVDIKEALKSKKEKLEISTDLGLTSEFINLYPESDSFQIWSNEIYFPVSFREDTKICYFVDQNQLFPLKIFSEESNFFYSLVPTSWRPILRLSATPMHKKPFLDAIEKFQFKGMVLDSGTGLGYSAIVVSKTATRVISVEWDKMVLEIASYNPHSKILFSSENIELRNADITDEILLFEDNYFDNIIHDGGMPKSSGNFFSQDHCNQLYRVLKSGGYLAFYLPQHGRSKGRDYGAEHLERLKKAGFYVKARDIEGSYAVLYKGN